VFVIYKTYHLYYKFFIKNNVSPITIGVIKLL